MDKKQLQKKIEKILTDNFVIENNKPVFKYGKTANEIINLFGAVPCCGHQCCCNLGK